LASGGIGFARTKVCRRLCQEEAVVVALLLSTWRSVPQGPPPGHSLEALHTTDTATNNSVILLLLLLLLLTIIIIIIMIIIIIIIRVLHI